MFNLHEDKNYKEAMAFGPRAMQAGNFAAGAKKFRLVEISEESTPKIASIRDSINSTYADDGGELYFLFAAENRYSDPMDVNDERTLAKMHEEKQMREDFVEAIYLRDMDDLTDAEESLAVSISKIGASLAEYALSEDNSLIDNPEDRKAQARYMTEQFSELPLIILEQHYKTAENGYLFEQFDTNNIDKANPVRFAVDQKKLSKSGLQFEASDGMSIYDTYKLYTKSAGYHPEVAGKGEIQMLDESISKLEGSKDEKYDVNSYVSEKIEEIQNAEEKKNMKWAWALIKRLKLPLQYPSWVAIGWPQADTRRLNLDGMNHGDNRRIESLEEIGFTDEESGKKMVWRGGQMVPAKGSGDLKLPTTPQATLLQIIGKNPSESVHAKSVEYLRSRLRSQMEVVSKSKDKRKITAFKRAKYLRIILSYYEMIRDNMNKFKPNDTDSFFYLYDEICHLYFSYNRERYGDGIMLQYSASYDNGKFNVISPKRGMVTGRANRPFIPTTLHDDLREVVVSVHYAYGTEIPHFASTMFPGDTSLLLDESMLQRVVQKASEKGLKKLTVEDNQLVEKEIPTEELIDFFTKMANGGVLVYRVRTTIDEETNEEKSNIIWYAGMRSFMDRFDEKLKVERMVHDEEHGMVPIEGYGRSRISSGSSAISSQFKEKLAVMQSFGSSEGNISMGDWEDVYVDNSLMGVYQYANMKWGLDYDFNKLEAMSAKKIKSISPNIIKEMSTSSEKGIISEVQKLEQSKRNPTITITENTQDLVREIVSEIAKESLESEVQPQGAPVQETEVAIMPEETPAEAEEFVPSASDVQEYKQHQFAISLAGGVALNPAQITSLQQKGYILEQIGNGLYKIVQSPAWAEEPLEVQ